MSPRPAHGHRLPVPKRSHFWPGWAFCWAVPFSPEAPAQKYVVKCSDRLLPVGMLGKTSAGSRAWVFFPAFLLERRAEEVNAGRGGSERSGCAWAVQPPRL